MALMHKFDDWRKCVSRMTKEAKKSTASHYVLYTGKGDGKPSYLLCSAEDEVKSLLVESLDNGRVIHRVGETSQLTGPRLFVWDDDLPPSVVWAVCKGVYPRDEYTEMAGCFYCAGKKVRIYGEYPEPQKKVHAGWFLRLDGEHIRLPVRDTISAYRTRAYLDDKGREKLNELLHTVSVWGAIEHRWFGLINLMEIAKDFPQEHVYRPFTYLLHDFLLGSRDKEA